MASNMDRGQRKGLPRGKGQWPDTGTWAKGRDRGHRKGRVASNLDRGQRKRAMAVGKGQGPEERDSGQRKGSVAKGTGQWPVTGTVVR